MIIDTAGSLVAAKKIQVSRSIEKIEVPRKFDFVILILASYHPIRKMKLTQKIFLFPSLQNELAL